MTLDILRETDAVIFDLDGSLVDSMWVWGEIDIEYLARFGYTVPPDLQPAIEGFSFFETAQYVKKRFALEDSLEQIMADWNAMAWDKYLYEVPLKPGAAEFLAVCRERKIRLGIATSNSRELVTNVADAHGLHDWFDCILTAGDVGRGKPAPDIYLEVARRLGVSCSRCLVFEDVVAGIQAGKAAGMRVCAVYDEAARQQDAQKRALADWYIQDYRELIGACQNSFCR